MKAVLIAAAVVALSFGGFAERSATISVDWRGLPNVEGILREDSKALYGFSNFIAYGPRWQYVAQDYAAKEHRKEKVTDPVYGEGLLFTGRLWAGKVGLKIREEFYDVTKDGEARVHVRWTITHDNPGKPMGLERAYVRFPLSRAEFAGGKAGVVPLPAGYDGESVDLGGESQVRVVSEDGRKTLLVKALSGRIVMRDARKDRCDRFELCLEFPETKGSPSSTIEFELAGRLDDSLVAKEGRVDVGLPPEPVEIAAGDEWVAFPYGNRIKEGTILDFSDVGTRDAPAGKYGFVKVNGEGHFSFEKNPKSVRFVGGNLCFDANFLTARQCREAVSDFVRRGWNAIRFHHLDITITKDEWTDLWMRKDLPELSPTRLDQLDRLMAECREAGIYMTFDLYAMGSLGSCEGMDGKPLNGDTVKAWVPVHRPAEDLWFRRAMELFDHVNPYTGLSWKNDPAILFVTLMNEDSISSAWRGAAEKYFAEYDRWAAEKGRPKLDRKNAGDSKDFAEFLTELKATANRRMTARLRAAGVRCLCTGGNWWDTMQQTYEREALDVVDNHAYADHPQPSYQKIPFLVRQEPDLKNGNAAYCQPLMKAPTRIFGKPFTMTEYNYCVPNRWRADGGLMMGAYASLQDWDALYRFAWSHSNAHMFTPSPIRGFDIVTDPLSQLSERQVVLLFGRGDVAAARRAVAYAVRKDEAMEGGLGDMWLRGLFPYAFTRYAMVSRIGSFVADDRGLPAVPCERVWDKASCGTIPKQNGIAVSDTDEICLDTRCGDMAVSTEKTAAVCSVDRHDLVAGPLRVSKVTAFCSVSASAMDAMSLAESRKVLVLHLTDVLNTGMTFTSSKRTNLKRWGTLPYLAKTGKAEIALDNVNPDLKVYALASDGTRLREVSATYEDGVYRFVAEVKAGEGVAAPTMIYELAP